MTHNWNLGISSRLSTGPPGTCLPPFGMPTSQARWWVQLMHTTSPSADSKKSRGQPCPFYVLVSAVSYSLSLRSSKMSTSTLALPSLSGARLMRFLARVMESRSPLLHSMGSSKIAAVGRQPHGDSWYPCHYSFSCPVSHNCHLLSGSSRIALPAAILRTVPKVNPHILGVLVCSQV